MIIKENYMTNKALFIKLGAAYIEDYRRSVAIYDALAAHNIYIDESNNPLTHCLESILNELNQWATDILLELAENNSTKFYEGDKQIICRTIEEVANFLFGEE